MFTRRSQANTPSKPANVQVQPQQQLNIGQKQQPQHEQKESDVKPVVVQEQPSDANGVKKQKPEWQLRKVDPETKRLRQNARVKKVVKPKPANMVLHEMYPDIVYKIDEVASNKTSIYRVHFDLNNVNYSGEGFSKSQAKVNACEQALKALLLERVAKEQEAEKNDKDKGDEMETDESNRKPATDDFPWGKLAGFALQKLMDSWAEKAEEKGPAPYLPPGPGVGPYPPPPHHHHQGYSHPNHVSFSNYSGGFQNYPPQREPKPFKPAVKVPTAPRKKFPENPLEYNAVALFNQTWPNTDPTYDTTTVDGKPEHTATLVLEGFRFSSSGKNKKEVKLQLAKAIISTLKGVKYPDGFSAQVTQA